MDEEDLELEFISGRFLEDPLPKEKTWLLKYFRREREQQFVKYFLIFNNYWHFVDQTGYYFCIKNLNLLVKKLKNLMAAHAKAKSDMDLELLAKIETGKYKWLENK